MAEREELTLDSPDLVALSSERKRLAENLFATGVITQEGLEKIRSDPEVVVAEEQLSR